MACEPREIGGYVNDWGRPNADVAANSHEVSGSQASPVDERVVTRVASGGPRP